MSAIFWIIVLALVAVIAAIAGYLIGRDHL